ncbi:cytochrome b/b6 domain-containing protein [Defluviimonas sp. WL0002]|uniref:Cytochrome b/b6 domain-containing protein n=1 Tax=Albidovulum marisflavi TaxID=2984159 RepID=A0ABT2ZB77_9RHOB|nr:cytochrome b/b6 domain-containing protein [Defluviimonas sp. WL0002]MCV2868369.1 cytochrome b/b6 domain-containing protein [Defluviimonas sp. WL0002]
MRPAGYSRVQIALHWAVLVLLLPQYLFEDGIKGAWRAYRRGQEAGFDPTVPMHVFGGLAILLIVAWRIAIRMRRGAPALPPGGKPVLDRFAGLTHLALYALLLALPITGAAAWFGGLTELGEVHEVLKTALLILSGLHVLAAVYHQFVLRDGLMERMKRPAG